MKCPVEEHKHTSKKAVQKCINKCKLLALNESNRMKKQEESTLNLNEANVQNEKESVSENETKVHWIYSKLVSEQMFFESDGQFPCYPFIRKFWNNEDFMGRYDDDEEWDQYPKQQFELQSDGE